MEHLIGKGVDALARMRHAGRIRRWKAGAEPFFVDGETSRFSILASAAAGRAVPVTTITGDVPPRAYRPILLRMGHQALLPEHGFAWTDGETIFLPPSFVDMESADLQEALARTAVFFLAFQIREGSLDVALENRALLDGDPIVLDLFWIIENRRLAASIRREFPQALRHYGAITERLLSRRPGRRLLKRAEAAVEDFLRRAVRGQGEGPLPASSEASLSIAMEMKKRWGVEGLLRGGYRALVPFTPWGKPVLSRIKGGAGRRAKPGVEKTGEQGGSKEQKKAPSRIATVTEKIDEEAYEQGLLLNIYDKLISWAEFVNVPRPFDDDPEDDNEKKASEMEEVTVASVSRGTRNWLDADLEKGDSYEAEEKRTVKKRADEFFYDEWDWRKKEYRKDYSRLLEMDSEPGGGDFVEKVLSERRAVIKETRRKFEALAPEVRFVKRQIDGELIDIDAAVDAAADMAAGRTPDEKLYIRYRRLERDVSALFLVDQSMSTDTWVGDMRVIDHEKEALIILCEAMERLSDRYAVYGFSGRNRTRCNMYRIKTFDERYGQQVRERIGGIEPLEYTRMGPAIRHATGLLDAEGSRIKLLFILSDGKPNDVDVYEGRYGVEDTCMAVKEAERKGIVPFCLTVDRSAAEYLPRVFGRGGYAVLADAGRLARALPEFYSRIVKVL